MRSITIGCFFVTLLLACAGDDPSYAYDCGQYDGVACAGPDERFRSFKPECGLECCAGSEAAPYWVPAKTWWPSARVPDLPGGCAHGSLSQSEQLCVRCGDGVCDRDALESWCVCPADCPEVDHNPCAAIEAKLDDCGIDRHPRSTCAPYTDCANACFMDLDCDRLADEAVLASCLAQCPRDLLCTIGAGGAPSHPLCELCPAETPDSDTPCSASSYEARCHYRDPALPLATCVCEDWRWRCVP